MNKTHIYINFTNLFEPLLFKDYVNLYMESDYIPTPAVYINQQFIGYFHDLITKKPYGKKIRFYTL